MKLPCATFSDKRHVVQTTKLIAFVLEVLLKTEPPNLGIVYTDKSHMALDTHYNETSMCDLLGYATCCSNY